MAPADWARYSPATRASYFTSLLVVGKSRWTMHSISSHFGEWRTTPAPPACSLDDPLVCTLYQRYSFSSWLPPLVNSKMKSATTFPIMALWGRYCMSNSLYSIAHSAIHPVASGLLITRCKGLSVKTITVWAWKYGLSLWAAITKAKASFSISGYLSSTQRSARLA